MTKDLWRQVGHEALKGCSTPPAYPSFRSPKTEKPVISPALGINAQQSNPPQLGHGISIADHPSQIKISYKEIAVTTPHTKSEQSTIRSQNTSDAIELLKADHRKVEALFEEFENAKRKDRKEKVALEICDELSIHAAVEEEALYPPAKKALGEEDADLVPEAIVEHSSLKWLIQQIIDEEPGSELYDAKVIVLKEYVSHHVKEEEKELFPKLKKSDLDLKAIGDEIVALKSALTSKRKKH